MVVNVLKYFESCRRDISCRSVVAYVTVYHISTNNAVFSPLSFRA